MSDALFEGLRPHRGQTLSRKPPFILCRHDAAGPFTLALFVRELFFEAPTTILVEDISQEVAFRQKKGSNRQRPSRVQMKGDSPCSRL